eukprot:jgi/Ulvmu1/7446/UM036_0108.1
MIEDVPARKDNGSADAEMGGAAAAASAQNPSFLNLRPFIVVSTSYVLYTITDGAIRMIVLLHAYRKGFSAMEVAIMFTLYELAGVVTNLLAGIAGSRWGIRSTLVVGLFLQLAGISMLYGWRDDWSKAEAIAYVTASQMLCGVAKDLTKLGGKTVAKLVTPAEKQSYLFKLVAFITGLKNSLKGAGYFLGAATVAASYDVALSILLGIIGLGLPGAIFLLDSDLGKSLGKKKVTLKDVFKMNYNINVLSAARIFLFGSRDAWFEVPLPFFLRDNISGLGWRPALTGAFLAIFIIVYGQVQSWSPHLLLSPLKQAPANKFVALLWAAALLIVPGLLGPIILASDAFGDRDTDAMTAILVSFLAVFCFIFAVNSAVHSYLVLRYSDGSKVAVNVGFYYMSNAAGRLVGTVMSGVLYSYAGATRAEGFGWCFILSAIFVILCTGITTAIRDDEAGLMCGSCVCVRGTAAAERGATAPAAAVAALATEAPMAIEMEPMGAGAGRDGDGGGSAAGIEGGNGDVWVGERRDEVRQRDPGLVASVAGREGLLEARGMNSVSYDAADGAASRRGGRLGHVGQLSYPGPSLPEGPLEEDEPDSRKKSHSADAVFVRPYVSAIDSGSLPLSAAHPDGKAERALQPRSSPAGRTGDGVSEALSARLHSTGLAAAPLSTPAAGIVGSNGTAPAAPSGSKPGAAVADREAADGAGTGEERSDSLRLGGPGIAAHVLTAGSGVDSDSGRAVRLDTVAARRAAGTPGGHSTGSATLRHLGLSPGASPLSRLDHSTGGGHSSTNDSFRTIGPETTASTGDTGLAGLAGMLPAADEEAARDARAEIVPSLVPRSPPVQAGGEDGDAAPAGIDASPAAGEMQTPTTYGTAGGSGETQWTEEDGPPRHIYQPPSEATAAGAIAEAPPLLPFVTNDMFQRGWDKRG